jgi:hypothetical protein
MPQTTKAWPLFGSRTIIVQAPEKWTAPHTRSVQFSGVVKMRKDASPTRLRRRQGRQPMEAQALIQAANHHIIQMVTP